jgi:hypothetical protein
VTVVRNNGVIATTKANEWGDVDGERDVWRVGTHQDHGIGRVRDRENDEEENI